MQGGEILGKKKFLKKHLTSTKAGDIIKKLARSNLICGSAGIGRQARLRGVCRTTYGFKSHLPHQKDLRKQVFFDIISPITAEEVKVCLSPSMMN